MTQLTVLKSHNLGFLFMRNGNWTTFGISRISECVFTTENARCRFAWWNRFGGHRKNNPLILRAIRLSRFADRRATKRGLAVILLSSRRHWLRCKAVYPKGLSRFSRLSDMRMRVRSVLVAASAFCVLRTRSCDRKIHRPCQFDYCLCRTRPVE